TIWLINNYPGGIEGESNPLGVLIYEEQGFFGIIFAKISVFMILSAMVIIIEYLYKHEKKIMPIVYYTIIGLTGWSLIVVTVNVMLMYLMSLQGGLVEAEFLPKLYAVLFAMTFGFLIIVPKFYPAELKKVELILAAVVLLMPMAIVPGIYQNILLQDIFVTIVYFGAIAGIIATMILTMNKLYKNIK
ncbi:MAG: hypothetical protein ACE5RC_07030, partial [Nitrosopumilus sp.]